MRLRFSIYSVFIYPPIYILIYELKYYPNDCAYYAIMIVTDYNYHIEIKRRHFPVLALYSLQSSWPSRQQANQKYERDAN